MTRSIFSNKNIYEEFKNNSEFQQDKPDETNNETQSKTSNLIY